MGTPVGTPSGTPVGTPRGISTQGTPNKRKRMSDSANDEVQVIGVHGPAGITPLPVNPGNEARPTITEKRATYKKHIEYVEKEANDIGILTNRIEDQLIC